MSESDPIAVMVKRGDTGSWITTLVFQDRSPIDVDNLAFDLAESLRHAADVITE